MRNIPVYQPSLTKKEKEYVNECLDTNWITSKGRFVDLFEKQFCEYIGVDNASTVCNGTIALHLALTALGIGPGDEVIVPTFTYIASVNAIMYTGATPVFVDSEEEYWQIDIDDVKKKVTDRTRAVMAVHLYGHPCDMDELVKICKSNDIFLVEDSAEALGSKYKNQNVGTFGDISTFSFYGNKTITTGEGGMVVTNDQTLFERLDHLKKQGLAKHREYWHDVIGYNYRMTNLSAAIGVAQLERIEAILKKKRAIAACYRERLKKMPVEFHKEADNCYHSYWMCSILVDKPKVRDVLRDHLSAIGIETRPTFYPIHTMPMYSKKYEKHRIAESLGWRGMNLPSYPDLQEDDIQYICDGIIDFFQK